MITEIEAFQEVRRELRLAIETYRTKDPMRTLSLMLHMASQSIDSAILQGTNNPTTLAYARQTAAIAIRFMMENHPDPREHGCHER